MTDVVTFQFYSDTNMGNAYDELDLMGVDVLKEGTTLTVAFTDYKAMGDSIDTIIGTNSGDLLG